MVNPNAINIYLLILCTVVILGIDQPLIPVHIKRFVVIPVKIKNGDVTAANVAILNSNAISTSKKSDRTNLLCTRFRMAKSQCIDASNAYSV